MKNKKKLWIIIIIIIVALLLIGGGTTAIIVSNSQVNDGGKKEWMIDENQTFTYSGEEIAPKVSNLDENEKAKVVYSYSEKKDDNPVDDTYTTGLPKDAGTYYVKASYLDSSKVVTMVIEKANLTLVDLDINYNNPNGDYFTSETDPKSVDFLYTFTGINSLKIEGELSLDTNAFTPGVSTYDYTFIPNDSNYSIYHNSIDLNIYVGVYLLNEDDTVRDYFELPYDSIFEYDLTKRDGYQMPYITLEDGTVIDDTFKITDDINLYYVENVENFTITYNLDGGVNGDNPDTYTMFDETFLLVDATKTGYKFLGWYTDSEFAIESKIEEIDPNTLSNYILYAKFEWIKINPTIQFNDLSLVYTGQAQVLVDVSVEGGTVTYSLDGIDYNDEVPTAVNAGTYTVYYKVKGDTYHLNTSGTRTVKILKSVYDMSGITLESKTTVYNGSEQGITISGELPEGVSVSYSGLATNAGTYEITASFIGDSTNYEAITSITATLTIEKANLVYTLPASKNLVFNDANQELIIPGSVFEGLIEYSLDDENYSTVVPTGKNIGNYVVYYHYVVDETNYNSINSGYVSTFISQGEVEYSIPLANDLTYTGVSQELVVYGSINVGEIEYSLDGLNYNSTIPTGLAAGKYEVYYRFIYDKANYTAIEDGKVLVSIKKANSELTAPTANALTYNGSAQELVNAGTAVGGTLEYSLDGTEYSTSIPTGKNAGTYTVYYRVIGDINHNDIVPSTIDVTIAKATYDMTGISMENRTVKYDGTEYGIEISGDLPEGVSVSYSGLATNAGTYEITASFTGDSTNYEAIASITATLTIEKADVSITAPTANALTYNGSAQELVNAGTAVGGTLEYSLDGTEYSTSIPTGKNAGTYNVYYRVNLNAENYNSIDSSSVQVTIALATITGVTVNGYNGQYDGNNHNIVTSKTATTVDDSLATWTFSVDGVNYESEIYATLASDSGTYYYKVSAPNHKEITGSFLVVISDKIATTVSISNLDSLSKEYDGQEIDNPTVATNSDGDVIVTYSLDGETYTSTKPITVGIYRIKVEISETTQYTLASQVFVIAISKKALTISGIVVDNKAYDGTTTATVSNYGSLVGIINTDDVTIDTTGIVCNFASDLPENDILVTLSGYVLSGLDSENYSLANSWTATANIEKANVIFVAPTAKTLTYTGNAQALINNGTLSVGTIEYSLDGTNYDGAIPLGINAATYTIYYKVIVDLDKYNEIPIDSLEVTITKAKVYVTAPEAKVLTYDGSAQELVNAGIINPGAIEYSLDNLIYDNAIPTGTNAGNYTVYYEFTIDTSNYEIVGDASGLVNVTIAKATYDMTGISMEDRFVTYDGTEYGIAISGDLPEGVNVSYSGLATNAGTYEITATFTGDATNYEAIASITATLTIEKATATAVLPTAKTLTYTGNAQALINEGTTNAGTVEYSLDNFNYGSIIPTGINAGSYNVYYRFILDETNYDTTSISNGSVFVTIAKATYDMTGISMEDRSVTYDGTEYGIEISGDLPEGVSVQYAGLGTNVGYYEITAIFTGDTANYEVISSMTAILTITKAQVSVTAPLAKSLTYNGSAQDLVVAGVSLAGTIAYSTNGTNYFAAIPTGTNAGNYTVYYEFTIDTSNYEIVGDASGLVNVTIAKATYDMTGISMEDRSVTYDGTEYGIEISGDLPEGVNVSYSGLATNAGTYEITATFTGDATNYEAIASITATLTIEKATATAVLPTAKTLTYTGNAQALINEGTTNAGTVEYSLDNFNYGSIIPTGINAGSYNVYYRFILDETNYDTTSISNGSVSITIAKATATAVLPTAKTLTYTGNAQALINEGTTNAGTVEYSLDNFNYGSIIPTGINAGSYNVYYRFILDETNYDTTSISNGSVSVIIEKATATLVAPTAKSLTYNGSAQALINIGTATVGTIEYSIDDASYNVSVPKGQNAGNYTVYYRFTLNETNYDTQSVETTGTIAVTIAKASVTATAPTAKALTYTGNAQALINAGSISLGSIEYKLDSTSYSTTIPTGVNAGNYTVYYKYTYDTANYQGAIDGSIIVTIAKATPTYTIPTGLSATPTMTLGDITLPTGFAFSDPLTTSVGNVGDNVFNVTYTPTDTTNYKVVTGLGVTIHVSALVKLVISAEDNMETVYDTSQHGPNVAVSASGNIITSGFNLSYQHKLSTASSYTTGLPTNAGSYLIKINCSGSGYSDAEEVIVNYTINKEKVKFIATNFEANYNENIRTWEAHKNYLESKLSFTTLDNVPVILDGYEIVSMNNGYYGYGTDASSYKTIDNVAGSVYIVHVDFTNGNYEIVGNNYFIYTYRTAVVDSTYYTIEEALVLGKDITLAGSVNSTTSYVVTSTCNLDDDLYPYDSRSFTFSKILYVPYTNRGKTAFTKYETTGADTEYTCSALTITNRVSITFSGTVNVCAKVAGYGTACNHGVLYNDGNLTFTSGSSLYSYGYVKGNGMITLLSGSVCQDIMRFWDYGTATTLNNVNSAGAWPITIWQIHNISCPTKIFNGSTYKVYSSTYGTVAGWFDVSNVIIIGKTSDTNCLFKPQSSASANDYILKYTNITDFGNANNATIKNCINGINDINGSNQLPGQIDVVEIHGKYQDATLSITMKVTLATVNIASSTTVPFVIPYMNIKIMAGSNLILSKSSYVFGLGTYLYIERGSTLTINGGYVATDQLTGSNPTIFKYFGGNCKNNVNSYIKVDGMITGTGSIGGIIKCDEENAILNISNYSVNSIKTKNTSSPYYNETTNYQATGTIKNSGGTVESNVAFANGNVYASFLENSLYYFEVNNNYNTFTINYYVDGVKTRTQEITVVNTDTYVVTGNEYVVSKDYYNFIEWLDSNGNELGTNGNNILTTSNSSIDLYASFELKNYHFSYGVIYNGVDISDDVTYTNLIDTFTIDSFVDNKISITTTASYNDKYFDGWYLGIDKSSNIKLTQITKNQFIKFIETTGFDTIPFYGEFADTEYYNIAIVDSDNNTINALYTIPQGTSLNDNGVSINFDSNSYDNNSSFPSYLANFKNGSNTYTIDQIKDYVISGNIVFTAQWLAKNTIDLKNYLGTTETTVYCIPNGKVALPDGENYYDIASSGASETSGYYSNKIFSSWNATFDENGLYTCTNSTSLNAIYNEEQYCKITFSVDAATIDIYGESILDGIGRKGNGATSKVSMNGIVYFTFTYTNNGEGTSQSCQLNGTTITANTNYTITKNSKIEISSTPASCVIEGTLVTLADGTTTAVENIQAGDLIKVFNHETGCWDVSYVMFNDAEELANYKVINLYFSDGTYIGIVSEHGFFDMDLLQYVYIDEDNYQDYIGHRFYSVNGIVVLESANITIEYTRVYSPVTAVHLNLITNGLLSMPGGVPGLFNIFDYDEDLKYDELKKNQDIDTYGLLDYSYFEDLIPYDVYIAFNGKYLGVAMAKGILTEENILYYIERYSQYW